MGYIIIYIENPWGSSDNFKNLIKFYKVAGYKVNTEIWIEYLYTTTTFYKIRSLNIMFTLVVHKNQKA